ncbi:MAG: alpha-L-fucosidase [Phycisphaeraceae bacterium]|nr:alpha-L-fucosidase [Phycisphaeraceae bacterium]
MKTTAKHSIVLTLFLLSGVLAQPHTLPAKPTPEQVAWHEMEIEMFVHFAPNTWQNREYDDHSTPLKKINPTQLDTDQWCEIARSFGAKQIIFVAKHVGGFCMWQTDTTDYSIKNTPYKNGRGDVMAELEKSCQKYGLKLGVYVYPGDAQWGADIGSGGRTKDPAQQEAYNEVFRTQLREVLTKYGEISEVWFDGSCVIDVSDILRDHAPKAMVFQGPQATLRWPGSESGIAPDPTWQTVKKQDALTGVSTGKHSDPEGDMWLPMEMDTTLLDHRWFWGPDRDHMLKSLDHLMKIYYGSVGRGSVLLLNASPDTTGRIPASHARRYQEFGKAIRRITQKKKGQTSGTGRLLELRFSQPTPINHVITMEDIGHGHRVRAYEIEGLIQGTWTKLTSGVSIGYKKIDVFDTVQVEGVRLHVTEAVNNPVIASFAAYHVSARDSAPIENPGQANPWQEVAAWKTTTLTTQWQILDIDLSPYILAPGQYEVEFRKTGGSGVLEVQKAMALMAGTESPHLITKLNQLHAWNINRTAQVTSGPKGRTALRVKVRATGKSPWRGDLVIRKSQ